MAPRHIAMSVSRRTASPAPRRDGDPLMAGAGRARPARPATTGGKPLRPGRPGADPAMDRDASGPGSDPDATRARPARSRPADLEAQNEALREALLELEESRDQYADLFDFAPVAYVTLDERGIIRNLNLVATAMLGVPRRFAVGLPVVTLVHPDHQGRFWNHLASCRSDVPQRATDLDLRLRERPRVPVQLLTVPRISRKGVRHFRTAILDLTDRRLAEQRRVELERESARREEAERSNQAREEFFFVLAHELRTPLHAMQGWTRLLRSGRLAPGDVEHALDIVDRNILAQVALINEVLDAERLMRGAARLDPRPLDAAEIVRACVGTLAAEAVAKGVALRVQVDGMGTIEADPDRLSQIVNAVLAYALEATPAGDEVCVSVGAAHGDGVTPRAADGGGTESASAAMPATTVAPWIRVVVTGGGWDVPPARRHELFEWFRGPRTEPDRLPRALGFRLPIAHRLAALHGGRLAIEDRPGGGAHCVVELPRRGAGSTDAGVGPAPARPLDAAPDLAGIRVLFVDDDPDARELAKRFLEPMGASLTVAASAADAFTALRALPPDVLVSDLAMPEEDGVSLLKRVRALPPAAGGEVPAIALTAYAGVGHEERALDAGYSAFVAKPMDFDGLAGLILSLRQAASARR